MSRAYDVVVVADPRFPGGTSTALAEELAAAAAGGWRCALVPLESGVLRRAHRFHPALHRAIEACDVEVVDPGTALGCGLVLAHHPELFRHPPAEPLRLRAEHRLLIAHHPPYDAQGAPFYDLAGTAIRAEEALGGDVLWAPVGPAVRAQLAVTDVPVIDRDWVNILDPGPWRFDRPDFVDHACVIGRHSRPDPMKWPDTRAAVLEAYPDDPRFRVEILGGGPFLTGLMQPGYPPGWRVRPFIPDSSMCFLRRIDFFVYYHHPRWIEAFGRSVLEAISAGCVAVLPPSFAATFADAACYAERADAPTLVLTLRDDRRAFVAQSQKGVALAAERFGPERHRTRLASLLDRPMARRAPPTPRRRQRVMLLTTNGVGLGHLTRTIAVAKRLPDRLEPVVVTMSQALSVVRAMELTTHYLPYHMYLGVDQGAWNHWLRRELSELMALYEPAVIVFDGNMPHGGVTGALDVREPSWAVWMRRPMWKPGSGAAAIAREGAFDAVLEPGELAASVDRGATSTSIERTLRVPPIRLLDPEACLDRVAARRELGIADDATAMLIALGAGNNVDWAPVWRALGGWLAKRPEITAVALMSPISDAAPDPPAPIRPIRTYPASRLMAAFDLAVSAVGYNSFHELLAAGVPTLFVPNEHPIMDDQLGRARWAVSRGLALLARIEAPYSLGRRLDLLADPARRGELRAAMAALPITNGAHDAALVIAEMADIVRSRPVATVQ